MRRLTKLVLLFVAFGVFESCSGTENNITNDQYIDESGFFLGTIVSIRLYGPRDGKLIDSVFQLIEEYENMFSYTIPTSDVSRINTAAGIRPVRVSDATMELVRTGIRYGQLSNGYFDITIGPLVALWGIGTENARVPTEREIQDVLPLVDFRKVVVDHEAGTVMLPEKGMAIDLGAIAKGYVADKTAELIKERGRKHGIINFGGNIVVVGTKPEGEAYKIGIQVPGGQRGTFLGVVSVTDSSVVSSGVYERYIDVEGTRYHHILDPFTGYPVRNSLTSVSIVSQESIDGDALSTAVFCLGPLQGLALVDSLDAVEAVLVTKDNKLIASERFQPIFTLTDQSFSVTENRPTE